MPEIETNNSPSSNFSKEKTPVPMPTDKKRLFMGKRGAKILAVTLVFILFAGVFLIFLQLSGEKSSKNSNTKAESLVDSNSSSEGSANDLTNQRGEALNERFMKSLLNRSKIPIPTDLSTTSIGSSLFPAQLEFLNKDVEGEQIALSKILSPNGADAGWLGEYVVPSSIADFQNKFDNLLRKNNFIILQKLRNQWVGMVEAKGSEYEIKALSENITDLKTFVSIYIFRAEK